MGDVPAEARIFRWTQNAAEALRIEVGVAFDFEEVARKRSGIEVWQKARQDDVDEEVQLLSLFHARLALWQLKDC